MNDFLIKHCFNSKTVIKNCVANIEIIPLPLPEIPLMFINFGNFCLFFRKKDFIFCTSEGDYVYLGCQAEPTIFKLQNMLKPFCALRG